MSKNYVKEYKGYKVPEGASCFVEACEAYRNHFGKTIAGVDYVFVVDNEDPEWVSLSDMLPLSIRGAVELPEEPTQEWVDGLPPIGCECEIKYFHDNESKWAKCYVVGETKDNKCLVINVYHDDSLHFAFKKKGSLEFRPLKTQEQKDRETFIEWAKAGLHLNIDDMGAAFKVVEQLADNGAKAPAGE